jgi:hypothetical protein
VSGRPMPIPSANANGAERNAPFLQTYDDGWNQDCTSLRFCECVVHPHTYRRRQVLVYQRRQEEAHILIEVTRCLGPNPWLDTPYRIAIVAFSICRFCMYSSTKTYSARENQAAVLR